MRAQKLQRGHSPGSNQGHSQITSQGLNKGPSRGRKESSNQGPVSQSNLLNPYPLGPHNQREKPRDRPLSAPSQTAMEGPKSQGSKIPQARPQSPGQVQKPQPGSNLVSNRADELVSGRPRGRSHSPCCRVDVDPLDQGQWCNGMRQATSSESLMVSSGWEDTPSDCPDPLSRSFPEGLLRSILPRDNSCNPSRSYSNSDLLSPPDHNHFLHVPGSDGDWGQVKHASRAGSSMSDLRAPATADKLNLAESSQMYSFSSDNLTSPAQNSTAHWWAGLSPCTSMQTSPIYLSASASSLLASFCSPPDALPSHPASPVFPKLRSTHCSPYGSPFGSQTQIGIPSVGKPC